MERQKTEMVAVKPEILAKIHAKQKAHHGKIKQVIEKAKGKAKPKDDKPKKKKRI